MAETLAERQAARDRILQHQFAMARRRAAELGRSIVCVVGDHSRCAYGEPRVLCLCECHDPAPDSEPRATP